MNLATDFGIFCPLCQLKMQKMEFFIHFDGQSGVEFAIMSNLFDLSDIDLSKGEESFTDLLKSENVRVERIVSTGQTSREDFWYDQDENEWVVVLQGSAVLSVQGKDGTITKTELQKGDYINLPAHTKHRVDYTDTKTETIWLAIFY